MKPVITGILSYGMSGRIFHAPFIDASPAFTLRAFVERSQKKALDAYPGAISYDSVDELLADPAIELVIVNTPNNTHEELARKSLEAGKHVLVEKPFAASSAGAESLFRLAEARNLFILTYQNRRWDSDFQSVKDVVAGGRLGRLIEVSFRFDRYKQEIGVKRFKEERLPAAGLSYDLGPHVLDQVICLFGTPVNSRKVSGCYRDGSLVDDYVSWQLVYPGQLRVQVTASLLTAQPIPAFVLHGTHGSYLKERTDIQEAQLDRGMNPRDPAYGVEDEGKEGILVIADAGNRKTTEKIRGLSGDYKKLFEAVYRQLREGEPYPVTKEQILTQMRLLEMPAAD